jgi:integrase
MSRKTKRSVEVIETFCGWDYLLDTVNRCDRIRDKALISALFETGGRVSEVLSLEKKHFALDDPDYIVVKAMPIFKRYKKIGEYTDEQGRRRWKTTKTKGYRTFPIPRREPLVPYLLDYLDLCKSDRLFNISRVHAWRIITKINPDVFPHWFRAQRASQLAVEYGFDVHDLVDFFDWKSLPMALHYSRMGWKGLAAKMKL